MIQRLAAVLAVPSERSAAGAPPGIDPAAFAAAMLDDVAEVLAGLVGVGAVIAATVDRRPDAERVAWPGTPVLPVPVGNSAAELLAALDGLVGLGAEEGSVAAADTPDLPPLLLAKLHAGLARPGAQVAICPASPDGLVALAARLPAPGWLRGSGVGLDTPDALARLVAVAPQRRVLVVGPGWHRLRRPVDIARLDPGLEGWPATRALLSGRPVLPG